jgi:hypothetical protein
MRIAYFWCTPVDGSINCKKKMALLQLVFEKRKWIRKCYWKAENVTEIQRLQRN